jgi:hypothetical protein
MTSATKAPSSPVATRLVKSQTCNVQQARARGVSVSECQGELGSRPYSDSGCSCSWRVQQSKNACVFGSVQPIKAKHNSTLVSVRMVTCARGHVGVCTACTRSAERVSAHHMLICSTTPPVEPEATTQNPPFSTPATMTKDMLLMAYVGCTSHLPFFETATHVTLPVCPCRVAV